MKKTLMLVLTLVLTFALLTGCAATPATTAAAAETTAAADAAPLYEQAAGKTYTVGTDTTFAPFEFEDENGKHTGIDIQLVDAIAAEMGFKVEWQILGFSASVTALEANQVDAVMAGMSITEERLKKYDFSDSYYDFTTAIAVADDSGIKTLEELKGKPVVAKTGTTGAQYAEKLAPTYGWEVLYVEESAMMYTYVESKQAYACFEDYPIVQFEISRGNIKNTVIHTSEDALPTGFATMKGAHPELVAAFNEGLKRLKANGTYDKILATYFG